MRIVSLLPSATEIVYALGLEPVGVSHECDYPPAAADIPAVNRSRVAPDAGSADINQQVVEAEREHGGVYEIDVDVLRDLDPDLIVTQGVCDVCAVDTVLVEEAVSGLDIDPEILTTDSHSLDDVLDDIRRIGRATGTGSRAEELIHDLEARIDTVEATADATETRPHVAVFDWMDPVMIAGHWVPEMVELAGATSGMAAPGERSRPREWNEVLAYDPDVIVAAPCGFSLDQTVDHLSDITARDGWNELAAVRDDRVYVMDGHHYMNRPGPRLVDSLEYVAAVIHPELFETPPSDAIRRAVRTSPT